MYDDLAAALGRAAWPAALELALAHWRAARSVELADLVDAIAARCPALDLERTRTHPEWMTHASSYQPLWVVALADSASRRLSDVVRWPDICARATTGDAIGIVATLGSATWMKQSGNLAIVDRFIAVSSWPADPRSPAILVTWLTTMPVRWAHVETAAFYRLVADRIAQIGDLRAVAPLTELEARPPALSDELRKLQQALARTTLRELAATTTPPPDPAAAELLASLRASAPAESDLGALWREVGGRPDDDAPRLVLADALSERGDPRGELIALQCAPPTPAITRRVDKLIRAHWRTWMGDLALVLTRRSEFRRGMLAEISVGMRSTPPWVYDKVIGHRELAVVEIVRAHQVDPDAFAGFFDAIDHDVAHVALSGDELAPALSARGKQWAARIVEYGRHYPPARWTPLVDTFAALAACFPATEELRLDGSVYAFDPTELDAALASARSWWSWPPRVVLDGKPYVSRP